MGWGIPPELFGPYTSGAVESVRAMFLGSSHDMVVGTLPGFYKGLLTTKLPLVMPYSPFIPGGSFGVARIP